MSAAIISQRVIGRATVTAISEGTGRWAPKFVASDDWRRAVTGLDAQERIAVGLTVFHIAMGDVSILIDPGFAEPGEPGGYVTPKLEEVQRGPGLGAALVELGIAPGETTYVVLTHAHADHCCGAVAWTPDGWRARYPRARLYLGWADWHRPPGAEPVDPEVVQRLQPLAALGRLALVDGQLDLVAGVSLLATPGETPGHLTVRVESEGERCYLLGDLFHHACEFEHLDWAPPGRDVAANVRSRQRLLVEMTAQPSLAAFTHAAFPPWGRAVRRDDRFGWESVRD